MRSQQKDIRRTTGLTTLTPIPDAASGNGIWSDGTPYHMVRTNVGEYTLYFDTRLVPLSGTIGAIQAGRAYYVFEVVSAGSVRVQCLNAEGVAVGRTFDVTILCLDTRL